MYQCKLLLAAAASLVMSLTAILISPAEVLQASAPKTNFVERKDALGDELPQECVARCGTIRMRTPRGIWSLRYVSEGKTLLAGDGLEMRGFNAQTGASMEVAVIDAHAGLVAYSSNGKFQAKASGGNIVLIELKSRSTSARFKLSDEVNVQTLALSPDGKFLAAAGYFIGDSDENDIRVWDVTTMKPVARLKVDKAKVLSLVFLLDGKVLASAGRDETVRLWDVAKWEQKGLIETDGSTMAASADGKMLATCASGDNVVRFWNPESGKKVGELDTGGRGVNALAFSPDGKHLATGGNSLTVHQWDIASGKEVLPLPGHREAVHTLVYSPDGKTLASRGNGRTIRFWDPVTGKEQRQIALGDWRPPSGAYGLAFNSDWTKLAVIGAKTPLPQGRDAPTFQVLDVKTGNTLFTFAEDHPPQARQTPPNALAISPDGQVLASASLGVRLFSLRSGEEQPRLRMPKNTLCAAFSPDGRTLAAGMQTPAKVDNLQLWDWTTGHMIRSLPGYQQEISASSIDSLSFSPGGHVLATCAGLGSGTADIRLWEVSSGTLIRSIKAATNDAVVCVALSPDGRMLASAGHDKTVRVWDAFTGKELAKFTGHSGPVNTVAWSPDGQRLASGSADTTILIWDTSRLKVEPPATDATPKQLVQLWDGLRQHESAKAFDALWSLVGGDDQAVAYFDQQLKAQPAPEAVQLRKLLANLSNDDPPIRDAASAALAKLGPLAEPALREKRKEEKLEPEARRRIDELLDQLRSHEPTNDELRDGRAVLALELIDSSKARDVLRKLADGAAGAPLTHAAKAALKRLR